MHPRIGNLHTHRTDRAVGSSHGQRWAALWTTGLVTAILAGCRGDLLNVPIPPNAIPASQVHDSAGAEAVRKGAIGLFSKGLGAGFGMFGYGGMLADEFYQTIGDNPDVAADTRSIRPGDATVIDGVYTEEQQARIQSLQAVQALEQTAATAGSSDVGEMFAVAGYAELMLAEHMCSGIPLGQVSLDGTVTFGNPLATDSVFATAVAHFDSAAAHAAGSALIANLAAIGRGRALLDRGRATDAGAAVATVPANFVYTFAIPNGVRGDLYYFLALTYGGANMADAKGTNGLPYVSAHDARLQTASPGMTPVGTVAEYPVRFPSTQGSNGPIPLADGVEAGLITAEAALASGNTNGWLAALNTLRANFVALRGPYPADTSYHQLTPLSDPGSDSARVSLMFSERAFWLYGTGHRLGDLRRLIRQYGRDQSHVFPVGAYVNGRASALRSTYGADVNYPIGPVEQGNPAFHGCLSLGA